MIEQFLEKLISELGASGLLIVGLYWILFFPLRRIANSMDTINKELGEIRDCIKKEIEDGKHED